MFARDPPLQVPSQGPLHTLLGKAKRFIFRWIQVRWEAVDELVLLDFELVYILAVLCVDFGEPRTTTVIPTEVLVQSEICNILINSRINPGPVFGHSQDKGEVQYMQGHVPVRNTTVYYYTILLPYDQRTPCTDLTSPPQQD